MFCLSNHIKRWWPLSNLRWQDRRDYSGSIEPQRSDFLPEQDGLLGNLWQMWSEDRRHWCLHKDLCVSHAISPSSARLLLFFSPPPCQRDKLDPWTICSIPQAALPSLRHKLQLPGGQLQRQYKWEPDRAVWRGSCFKLGLLDKSPPDPKVEFTPTSCIPFRAAAWTDAGRWGLARLDRRSWCHCACGLLITALKGSLQPC